MKARSGCAERWRPARAQPRDARDANRAREILCSFPEVPQVVTQVGRPDDGTDTTGFFNTEYFVDLLPKEQWRPVFHQDKERLIAAMDRELEKIPGVVWNFSQPISDNMEEAVSGVKGRARGQDLRRRPETLEAKADEIVGVMREDPGRGGSRRFPSHRPAESGFRGGPRQGRALRNQCFRCAGRRSRLPSAEMR